MNDWVIEWMNDWMNRQINESINTWKREMTSNDMAWNEMNECHEWMHEWHDIKCHEMKWHDMPGNEMKETKWNDMNNETRE